VEQGREVTWENQHQVDRCTPATTRPGGGEAWRLIAIGTKLDPSMTKSDGTGRVVGKPGPCRR